MCLIVPDTLCLMTSYEQRHLGLLQARYPAWEVWVVYRALGPNTWHARRKGDRLATLTADSPDELARKIEQAGPAQEAYQAALVRLTLPAGR